MAINDAPALSFSGDGRTTDLRCESRASERRFRGGSGNIAEVGGPDRNRIGLTGPELSAKIAHRSWQVGRWNCAPDCALTSVYRRQIPSLTGKHREICSEG